MTGLIPSVQINVQLQPVVATLPFRTAILNYFKWSVDLLFYITSNISWKNGTERHQILFVSDLETAYTVEIYLYE